MPSFDRLVAKVDAVNAVHEEAMKLYDALAPILARFVGKKVTTKFGHLAENVKKSLPPGALDSEKIYQRPGDYTIDIIVRSITPRYEVAVSLGSLERCVLTQMARKPVYRTDYTAEEIVARRQQAEALRKAFASAKNDLYPFGESDS